jgi:hypothetical protein
MQDVLYYYKYNIVLTMLNTPDHFLLFHFELKEMPMKDFK